MIFRGVAIAGALLMMFGCGSAPPGEAEPAIMDQAGYAFGQAQSLQSKAKSPAIQ